MERVRGHGLHDGEMASILFLVPTSAPEVLALFPTLHVLVMTCFHHTGAAVPVER